MARRTRRTIEQIEKDARAVDLRRRNLSYRQIMEQLGMSSTSRAFDAVQRGLADVLQEPADDVRRLELERLDEMARPAWRILHERHYSVSVSGKVALHPDTGQPLIDDGPTLAAIDRLLKIQERRARLLGLDAPVKAEVRHVDTFDADIARLVADMASRGQEPPPGHPEILPMETPSQS